MYTIPTLTALRRHLGLATADTADDIRLTALLEAASRHVERAAGRRFCPRRATIQHTIGIETTVLVLDDDLLTLESAVDASGTVSLSDIISQPDTGGDSPISILRLKSGRAFTWSATPVYAVAITGTWGWHSAWTRAWDSSADSVVNNPLSAISTTVTVADADGANPAGEIPRFQVGQLLKIDNEYLRVLAVNTATNQLTVERGVNGTTAASHTQTTAINVYRPAQDVEALVIQWAAWLYKSPDTRPPTAPPEFLTAALDGLRRLRV
jgi:hypothetical protein